MNVLGNGLDHADGDDIDERNEEGDNESPDGELRGPDLDRDDGEREHAQEDASVPPVRDLGVPRHETSMNIRHLGKRTSALDPDLLAEVEEGMRDGRKDRGERQTVANCECGGEEER